jgi:hypothetical protein
MANLPWLDAVQERLVKHGLPPVYIRRFLEELSDHFQDIKEEIMSTEANASSRLGEPSQLAESAVIAYRRRSFLGRHPAAAFAVFAVLPIVSLIVLESIALCVFALVIELIGEVEASNLTRKIGLVGQSLAPYLLTLLTVVIPSVVLSVLYCKLAKRLCIRKIWMFASCASLSAMAMLLCWSVRFSETPGQNALMLGLWIPLISGWIPPLRNLAQFIIPFAIGLWFMRRGHSRNQLQMAT